MTRQYPTDWDTRRKQVYQRDNYTCQNCGTKGGPYGNAELHAHHIVPKSKGGTHNLSNLKTMCNGCHKAIHGNRMAPSAQGGASGITGDDVELPSLGDTLEAMLWFGLFVIGSLVAPPVGLVVIGAWVWYKYKTWGDDTDSSTRTSSTKPGSITSDVSASAGKPISRHTDYGEYEPSWSTDSSNDSDNNWEDRINGYDPGRDPYAWDDTLSESSSAESTAEESEFETDEEDDSDSAEEPEDQEVPFDWYGDDDVPVEIVLDHIDTDLDSDTRHQLKQSVQKHRARGDAVDAADIRWVAEASERLDLEGDHPF